VTDVAEPAATPRAVSTLAVLPAVVRSQWLVLFRTPAMLVGSIVLPVVLYLVIGTANSDQKENGVDWAAYTLAGLAVYSTGAIMVINFGAALANERGQKVDLLIRASPMRPAVYLLAKAVLALASGVVALILLAIASATIGHTGLSAGTLADVLGRALLGSIPFLGLGMAIGYLAGPNAASSVSSLIYLLLSFSSGLFVPLSQLPEAVRQVAQYLPTYHAAQLAWSALGAANESVGSALLWLVAYGVFFFGAAARFYRKDSSERFN